MASDVNGILSVLVAVSPLALVPLWALFDSMSRSVMWKRWRRQW